MYVSNDPVLMDGVVFCCQNFVLYIFIYIIDTPPILVYNFREYGELCTYAHF